MTYQNVEGLLEELGKRKKRTLSMLEVIKEDCNVLMSEVKSIRDDRQVLDAYMDIINVWDRMRIRVEDIERHMSSLRQYSEDVLEMVDDLADTREMRLDEEGQ